MRSRTVQRHLGDGQPRARPPVRWRGDAGADAEMRKEDMRYFTDVPKVSQAASSGLAGSGAIREGERDIKALSAEVSLPLLKELEVGIRCATTITATSGHDQSEALVAVSPSTPVASRLR